MAHCRENRDGACKASRRAGGRPWDASDAVDAEGHAGPVRVSWPFDFPSHGWGCAESQTADSRSHEALALMSDKARALHASHWHAILQLRRSQPADGVPLQPATASVHACGLHQTIAPEPKAMRALLCFMMEEVGTEC